MKFKLMLLVLAAMFAAPANAATIFDVSGSGLFTKTTLYGSNQADWPPSCAGFYFCGTSEAILWSFHLGAVEGESEDGTNWTFSAYDAVTRESIFGSAVYLGNGAYQGTSLVYLKTSIPPFGPSNLDVVINGPTTNFSITQISPAAVPEPATWAMMLLGFGAIGAAMRRRRPLNLAAPLKRRSSVVAMP